MFVLCVINVTGWPVSVFFKEFEKHVCTGHGIRNKVMIILTSESYLKLVSIRAARISSHSVVKCK